MRVIISTDYAGMSAKAADLVAAEVAKKPDLAITLPTGSTPLGMYENLRGRKLDFSKVSFFNLDEYLGLSDQHPQSYAYFLWHNFLQYLNLKKQNLHLHNGLIDLGKASRYCEEFEKKLAEVDLTILGIGRNGHIGFNEPGSALDSKTRVERLAKETIQDNARFFDDSAQVPEFAVTLGIGTILKSKKILLLAAGENKAGAVAAALEGPLSPQVPASFLQKHPRVTFLLDQAAAARLRRNNP